MVLLKETNVSEVCNASIIRAMNKPHTKVELAFCVQLIHRPDDGGSTHL
jgi:hypothetical protein